VGLRIVHWDPNFLCGGAVSRSVLGLATNQVRLGAEVVVVAARPSTPPLYGSAGGSRGVTVFEWQPRWALQFDRLSLRGVPHGAHRKLRAFRPDVVHVHGGFNPDNLWVPRLFECPIVFSPHGSYHPQVFLKSRRIAKSLYLQIERRLLLHHVTAVHALSPIEAAHLRRLLPGRQVYCLPQGPGIPTSQPVSREEPDGPEGVVTFVFVGRLDVFTKGLDILLEAFAQAERRLTGRGIRLALVGPDWRGGEDWLRRRGRELGIADHVVFHGSLSGPQVLSALNRSHIYVQLSRHDAFSLSAAEALLMGKPAILSKAVGPGSYPEVGTLPHVRIVLGGASETAEAMVDCVRRLSDLQIAAEQHLSDLSNFFSWERIAKSQLMVYEKIKTGLLLGTLDGSSEMGSSTALHPGALNN